MSIDELENINFNGGFLSIKANDASTTAAQATTALGNAMEGQQVHSILLYDCAESGEPHYGTVANWVEALGDIKNQHIKKIIIDTPYQPQNRQSSILIGDLTPVLETHDELEELIVSGHFELPVFSHATLNKAEFTKNSLSVADVDSIASFQCPNLTRLGLNACEDGMPEGFTEHLINAFASNSHFNLNELYVFYSDEGQELIRGLCDAKLVDKLELIDLMDRELGYDPDVSMQVLLDNAKTLASLKTLRVPFNGLMDEERLQLSEAIPCITNSCPVDGEPANVPWYRPFSPQQYGASDFKKV